MASRLTSFFAELKRRRVYTVGVTYVVVGLGVLGAAELILEPLGLDSARPLVVVLTVLGFPLALVLAWAYEVTPEGIRRDAGPERATDEVVPPTWAGELEPAHVERTASPLADDKSIAVLPFTDMSPDGDQEYFGDGMAEELLNALAKLPGLRVAARTSTFAFKGRDADVQEIGSRLSVRTVLEGSVRKSGDRVRVTAQLIDATTGYHMWSETYQRELEDVFVIQDEIARSVVDALRVELLGGEGELVQAPTESLEAYELYLRGRHFWHRRYEVGLAAALEYFERAIAADPSFALAHAGVGDTLTIQFQYGFIDDARGVRTRAMSAVEAARSLDPQSPEVKFSEGLARFTYDLDDEGAVRAFQGALDARPEFAEAQAWLAITNLCWGRVELGLAQMQVARRMDPVSSYVRGLEAAALHWAGRFEASLEAADAVLAQDPSYALALYVRGLDLCELGAVEDGVATLQRLADLSGRSPVYLMFLIYGLRRAGRLEEADALFREVERGLAVGEVDDRGVRGGLYAAACAAVGRVEEFFDALDEAGEEFPLLPNVALWSAFDDVRADSRFDRVWARLGISSPPRP